MGLITYLHQAAMRVFASPLGFRAALAVAATFVAPARAADAYVIKPLRWEEDYSTYRPAPDASIAARLKHIDLGGETFVTLGGELRFRTESYDNPFFGLRAAGDFTSVQARALLHADLHPTSNTRVFVQLGGFFEDGREPGAAPFDESGPDIVQAFVDYRFGRKDAWRARFGRQEILVGRLIALRDGTNKRRTFDGARVTGPVGGGTFDAFAAYLTEQRDTSAFDDRPDEDDRMWGAVYARPLSKSVTATLTYIGRKNDRARFASIAAPESVHHVALRAQGRRGPLDFEAQASIQRGSIGALSVRAFAFASETGITLKDAPLTPRLALRLDAASGDGDPNDGVQGTLDLPYPNLSYLSDAIAIAPRNLADVHPFVSVSPSKDLKIDLGSEFLWRLERRDAIYAPTSVILAPPGVEGSYVGAQIYGRMTFRPSQHYEVVASVVHIEPGEVITNAEGEPQTYAAFHIATRF